MRCPFCQSDNLREFEEDTLLSETTLTCHCCEDCGASFHVVQEPQDILLEDIKNEKQNK